MGTVPGGTRFRFGSIREAENWSGKRSRCRADTKQWRGEKVTVLRAQPLPLAGFGEQEAKQSTEAKRAR